MNNLEPASNLGNVDGSPRAALTDERMDLLIGRLLQTGVSIAAAVVVIGGMLYLAHHGTERVAYGTFRPHPLKLRQPLSVLTALRHSGSSGWLETGILILLATPICRVIFALVAFAIERDRLYVAVSGIVLAVLLLGIFHGG